MLLEGNSIFKPIERVVGNVLRTDGLFVGQAVQALEAFVLKEIIFIARPTLTEEN